MRNSVKFCTTSAVMLLMGTAFPQDWRAELGSERAEAVELIIRVVSPGARIGWERQVTLTFPGDLRKALRLPGFLQIPGATGHLLVSAVEYPDDAKEAVNRLKAFEPVRAATAPSLIVLVKVSPGSSVRESRTMVLDPEAAASECRSIQIADQSTDDGWPRLLVTYRSWHSSLNMIGSIDWVALVDAASHRLVARMPNAFWRKSRDGSETGDMLRGVAVPGGVELAGVRTSFRRTFKCGTPCTVEPTAILSEER
jgi:hypothetical protein